MLGFRGETERWAHHFVGDVTELFDTLLAVVVLATQMLAQLRETFKIRVAPLTHESEALRGKFFELVQDLETHSCIGHLERCQSRVSQVGELHTCELNRQVETVTQEERGEIHGSLFESELREVVDWQMFEFLWYRRRERQDTLREMDWDI